MNEYNRHDGTGRRAAFFYREGRRLPVWGRLCSGYDEDDES